MNLKYGLIRLLTLIALTQTFEKSWYQNKTPQDDYTAGQTGTTVTHGIDVLL